MIDETRLDRLLLAALDLEGEARTAFLDVECGDDSSLRARLEAMLAAEPAGSFLDRGLADRADAHLKDLERMDSEPGVGTLVGAYRLLEAIGAGGQGRVYLAQRADGEFEQRVAIKFLRRIVGESREAEKRFQAERQILARLSHPHIAQIFDGGLTESGQPYLVMEYLPGRSITEHCRAQRAGIEERLRLFGQVGEAVSYAHANLVVHRDLKPSNIQVTEDGRVKLLDFGIAKLLDPADPASAPTRTGLLVLTPEYAAPEQLRAEPVTTATDVYALGLVLYELLTGERPFDIAGKSASEIERLVCHTEPRRPSTVERLHADDSPPHAPSALRGDLDTIVLEALRKEPTERYPSVRELVEDLRRYRDGLPVRARPATVGYRLGKFVRRHRLGLAIASGILALVVFFVAALAREQEETARQRDLAISEAAKANEITQFTLDLFAAGNPESGADLTARQLLDRGLERLETFESDDRVRADLLFLIGEAYQRLYYLAPAEAAFRRSLDLRREHDEPDSRSIRVSLDAVAQAVSLQGRTAEAEELFEEVLTLVEQAAGGRDSREMVHQLTEIGRHYNRLRDIERSRPYLERALETARRVEGPVHESVANLTSELGYVNIVRGDLDAARALYLEAYAIHSERLPGLHLDLGPNLHNLGKVAKLAGDLAAAEEYFDRALEVKAEILSEDHPSYANSLGELGHVYLLSGRTARAERPIQRSLEIKRATFGDEHISLISSLQYLGELQWAQGDRALGEATLRAAIEMAARTSGSPGRYATYPWGSLARHLEHAGRLLEAEGAYLNEIASWRTILADHRRTVRPLASLARLRADAGDLEAARSYLEEARATAIRYSTEGDSLLVELGALESRLGLSVER